MLRDDHSLFFSGKVPELPCFAMHYPYPSPRAQRIAGSDFSALVLAVILSPRRMLGPVVDSKGRSGMPSKQQASMRRRRIIRQTSHPHLLCRANEIPVDAVGLEDQA